MVTRNVICMFVVEADDPMQALAQVPLSVESFVENADEIVGVGMFGVQREGIDGVPAQYDEADHAAASDLLMNVEVP